jgi:phage portal protein BeeE
MIKIAAFGCWNIGCIDGSGQKKVSDLIYLRSAVESSESKIGFLPGEANEKNALRLLRSFEQAYTGRRNQRRPIVLPKGVNVKAVGDSLGDQNLKDYIMSNREVILALLDIPKQVVSLQEAGGLGSKEFDAAVRQFWQGTLKTTMRLVAMGLTKKLKDRLGEGYYLDFDLSEVEALRPDEVALADLVTKKMSYMTLNEVRSELELPALGIAPIGEVRVDGITGSDDVVAIARRAGIFGAGSEEATGTR